jgi:hypothetical protein
VPCPNAINTCMAPLLVRYTYLIERGMWHGVITVIDSHGMVLLQRQTVLAPYVVYFTWQQITNNSSKLTAVKCCQNKLHIQKNCILPQKHEYILCTSRHHPKSKHEDRNQKKIENISSVSDFKIQCFRRNFILWSLQIKYLYQRVNMIKFNWLWLFEAHV